MAFSDVVKGMKFPRGASERYKTLDAYDRQLLGSAFYADLKWAFEKEKDASGDHIPIRERRPSVVFALPYEIVTQTQAELFGDEQFPFVRAMVAHEPAEDATKAIGTLVEAYLQSIVYDAYFEAASGSAAVVIRVDPLTRRPYYDLVPGKFCEPVYASDFSIDLDALVVTYPIDKAEARALGVDVDKKPAEQYWYRYLVGGYETIDYWPLPDLEYEGLGEKRADGSVISFEVMRTEIHGFNGRVPAAFVRNLSRSRRRGVVDGVATWAPVTDICIELDYTLSQAGRGLRYAADPMLFIRQGELAAMNTTPMGYDAASLGGMAQNVTSDGARVSGVTQVYLGGPGSDAKLLEISANGIKEEREFAKDLRELALEIVGGQKSNAAHEKGVQSGAALQRLNRPLERLVRRQRAPFGDGLLLKLVDLTAYGARIGALQLDDDINVGAISDGVKCKLEWPSSETLTGQDLLYEVQALQLAAGATPVVPFTLMRPEAAAQKLAAELGMTNGAEITATDVAPTATPPDDGEKEQPSDSSS